MLRSRALAWVCASVLVLVCCANANAENLARLTVTSFTLAADTQHPQVEVPFHLLVSVRVRERVNNLDNLDLPVLAELELLGDERRWTSDTGGTTYRETITVVAHHTGAIHLAPATLDVIDARDGKGKRYSSNALDLAVSGGALQPVETAGRAAAAIGGALLWLAVILFGIVCAVLVVLLLFRRRRAQATATPVLENVVPAPPVPVRTRSDQLRDALTTLRADRTRSTAVRVRTLVWRMVGASERETLSDVLQRPLATEPAMRELLRALERAAFTHDADLPDAIESAVSALEQVA
jgi:hypothetical protein